ncbi:MAG: hypothetical protein ACT4OX_16460 [Actinomycetota bacterium]
MLGEEHRQGATLLPIERAMNERLHGSTGTGRRSARHDPPVWVDQYHATARTEVATRAAGDVASTHGVGTLVAPTAPARRDEPPTPSALAPGEAEPPTLDIEQYLATFEPPALAPHDTGTRVIDPDVPSEPEARADIELAPERDALAHAPPEPDFAIDPGPLDPEVQALVDDLYRKARAEIVGTFESPVHIDTVTEFADPTGARTDERPSSGPRRRGWVPAVLADRKKHDGGNGKSGGWRRLD